ncbi:carbonic anhydrase [Streptomyces armeniacus]|uniref:Carbonic anhydrase n=1 Tax=Streptomyces armeniacus TaxID=83291 RepID=A0A345XWB8_9ACTN|nr:carbonic anhydrase [Streptomyces armeniacus]AXK35934.1 carbonic anhydrase [Streptomyces armeniacus]
MQSFIHHARDFHSRVISRADERETFGRLAHGQSPEALFITCSDSRVVPSIFTGARPGQLFELRTAGNAVPPYGAAERPSGEAATIEYAVCVLQVPDIVVCGHSHCGAVGAWVRGDDLAAVPAVHGWLTSQLAEPAVLTRGHGGKGETRQADAAEEADEPDVSAAVQRHVRAQLERLRGYPHIAEREAAGQLRLHGWFYAVDTGLVLEHHAGTDVFLPL